MNFKRGQIKGIAKLIDPTENNFSKIKMEKRIQSGLTVLKGEMKSKLSQFNHFLSKNNIWQKFIIKYAYEYY